MRPNVMFPSLPYWATALTRQAGENKFMQMCVQHHVDISWWATQIPESIHPPVFASTICIYTKTAVSSYTSKICRKPMTATSAGDAPL